MLELKGSFPSIAQASFVPWPGLHSISRTHVLINVSANVVQFLIVEFNQVSRIYKQRAWQSSSNCTQTWDPGVGFLSIFSMTKDNIF